jgi:hypothetical protein
MVWGKVFHANPGSDPLVAGYISFPGLNQPLKIGWDWIRMVRVVTSSLALSTSLAILLRMSSEF